MKTIQLKYKINDKKFKADSFVKGFSDFLYSKFTGSNTTTITMHGEEITLSPSDKWNVSDILIGADDTPVDFSQYTMDPITSLTKTNFDKRASDVRLGGVTIGEDISITVTYRNDTSSPVQIKEMALMAKVKKGAVLKPIMWARDVVDITLPPNETVTLAYIFELRF